MVNVCLTTCDFHHSLGEHQSAAENRLLAAAKYFGSGMHPGAFTSAAGADNVSMCNRGPCKTEMSSQGQEGGRNTEAQLISLTRRV